MSDAVSAGYARFDVVVMACSLGGPHAVVEVLQALPASFPAAVAVVQHLSRSVGDILPRPFQREMPLPVEWGHTGELLRPGHVYLAPSDRHMLVTSDGCIQLTRSVPVGHCRPAADPLFASGAAAYHHRTLGVVLSGCCCDGAIGVQAIKWSGGMTIAQDQASSMAFGMPRAAIATGCVDLVLPLRAIGPAVVGMVMSPGLADFLGVPLQVA